MTREFGIKVIDIKFTVVFCFRTFPSKMKFHDTRDHFMMVRDTSFKNVCIHKTRFEICKPKIDTKRQVVRHYDVPNWFVLSTDE